MSGVINGSRTAGCGCCGLDRGLAAPCFGAEADRRIGAGIDCLRDLPLASPPVSLPLSSGLRTSEALSSSGNSVTSHCDRLRRLANEGGVKGRGGRPLGRVSAVCGELCIKTPRRFELQATRGPSEVQPLPAKVTEQHSDRRHTCAQIRFDKIGGSVSAPGKQGGDPSTCGGLGPWWGPDLLFWSF